MMRSRSILVTACGALLWAAGCGGGGSGVHRLDNTLRSYAVGDEWVYTVSGTWKGALVTTSIPMYGTVTRSMGTLTMAGTDFLGVTVFQDLQPQSAVYRMRRYTLVRQDAGTRHARALGDRMDSGFWRMVISNPEPVSIPGAWAANLAISTTTQYENGAHSHFSFAVEGTETIVTPAGAFETYRVAVTE